MIEAQAVLSHLTVLGDLAPDAEHPGGLPLTDWLSAELQNAAFGHRQDADGNYWVTLPGKSRRSVVLGSFLETSGIDRFDCHLGVVAALETMKAVARREGGRTSCALQLVIWKGPQPDGNQGPALLDQDVAAYLELHAELLSNYRTEETPPNEVGQNLSGEPICNPRLMLLCDEAVLELTGRSASSPSKLSPRISEVARAGIPAAVMTAQIPAASASNEAGLRLPVLQAAEAYGRWVESTMHLLAGENVDLWAREHRVPNS